MKKLFFILPFILFLSCAKPPEPLTARPESSPLETPEEIGRAGLSLKRTYESGSELFNFFFWPSGLDREALKRIAADVSEIGIEIEDKYKLVDENNFKISKIEKQIEKTEEERNSILEDLYHSYKCEGTDSCSGTIYPQSCDQLAQSPWNSETLKEECTQKEEKINADIDEKIQALESESAPLYEENESVHLPYITSRADAITALLENNNEKSEEWKNWIQTKEANITFLNGLPQLSLKIMFNNVLPGVANRPLYYKSKDQADIVDLRYYLEREIPVLEFKILEKRATRVGNQNSEERTGVYYTVKIRQTELDYGLEYIGDVERFDASRKSFGKGLMKIYIKPKY